LFSEIVLDFTINEFRDIMMTFTYRHTLIASFASYLVQAVINNYIPLLFLTFRDSLGIPLSQVTLLITINFSVQLLVDLAAAGFVDKIGYKTSIIAAHVFAATGFAALAILPGLLDDPFHGLVLAVMIYATGGGLLEVLVSPIVEACPTNNKESVMSLLHSFYSWGHVAVILISTVFFVVVGIDKWRWLTMSWAIIPILLIILFSKVPIRHLISHGVRCFSLKELLDSKLFWAMILMMITAGASEQAVNQWVSAFAEMGLGVNKAIGDLAGPMMFAAMMGVSRLFYGKYGDRIRLHKFMSISAVVCLVGYLVVSLSPWPFLSLIGCTICGLAVGIMWPGCFSISAKNIPLGGTMMFAFLALAGDIGCAAGPTLVGIVSGANDNSLNLGILTATIFPALLLVALFLTKIFHKEQVPQK
jgi:fucose permease